MNKKKMIKSINHNLCIKCGVQLRVPDYIMNIKSIHLTFEGMIELSCFPEVVIKHAEIHMVENADDPFSCFYDIANRYSKEAEISLDYRYRDEMRETFNIEEDAPKIYRK